MGVCMCMCVCVCVCACVMRDGLWKFPGGQVVRIWSCHCYGLGSIPGQGTEILQAIWPERALARTAVGICLNLLQQLPAPLPTGLGFLGLQDDQQPLSNFCATSGTSILREGFLHYWAQLECGDS